MSFPLSDIDAAKFLDGTVQEMKTADALLTNIAQTLNLAAMAA